MTLFEVVLVPRRSLTSLGDWLPGVNTEASALLGIIEPPVRWRGRGKVEEYTFEEFSGPDREIGLPPMRLVTLLPRPDRVAV